MLTERAGDVLDKRSRVGNVPGTLLKIVGVRECWQSVPGTWGRTEHA